MCKLAILLLLINSLHSNEVSEEKLTVSYVYKLSNNIIWKDNHKYFKIHVITSNTSLVNEFKILAQHLSLYNKKILITSSINTSIDNDTNVVYISKSEERNYNTIFSNTLKYPILLISNNYHKKNIVMINLFKTNDKTMNFEINRANILSRNLRIKPDLVLLGGTELDVAYLYKDTISTLSFQEKTLKRNKEALKKSRILLKNERKKLLNLEKSMQEKEKTLIATQKKIIDFNKNVLELKKSIEIKNNQLDTQEKKLTDTSNKLIHTQTNLTLIQSTIDFEKKKLKEEKIQVYQKEKLLKKLEIQIQAKTEEFEKLKSKIQAQNKIIGFHEETIHEQEYFLNISALALFFFIIVVFIITYLLKKQNKTNKLLESTQEELSIAKKVSDEANNNKSIFIANMSHELRTPLNAVLGYTHLLQKDTSFSKKHQKTFKIIQDSGQHLLGLINDILEISKMEAGFVEVNTEIVNLPGFIDNMYAMFTLKASQKGIYLKQHIADNVPQFIITDIDKIRQIFINLLSNATKFTNEGGIDLYISTRNSYLIVEVKDSGVGISTEEIPKLFEQYQQTQSGIQEGYGTGLGLALVKEFVNLLEGEITVKSELNRGSTFSIKIPYILSETTENASVYKEVLSIKENQHFTILVVDDIETNKEVLVEILELAHFNVSQAENGLEALESVKTSRPDIILMDFRMPIMGGEESSKHILEIDSTIPIIGVTASIMKIKSYLDNPAPFVKILPKPFKTNELFHVIQEYIEVDYIYESDESKTIEISLEKIPLAKREELLNATNSMNITVLNTLCSSLSEEYDKEKSYIDDLVSDLDFETLKGLLQP